VEDFIFLGADRLHHSSVTVGQFWCTKYCISPACRLGVPGT
jgi:hypothetical protein